MVERRLPAEPPSTSSSTASLRIFLQCLQLKLGLSEIVDDVEPIFASLAMYDVQAKKKVRYCCVNPARRFEAFPVRKEFAISSIFLSPSFFSFQPGL